MKLDLDVMPEHLAVCRLEASAAVPAWAQKASFYSISRTREELSVVCEQGLVPADIQVERGWRGFKVRGPLDFALIGILASLARTLAEARISIFAVSTFDTDYVLVRDKDFEAAAAALAGAGHRVFHG